MTLDLKESRNFVGNFQTMTRLLTKSMKIVLLPMFILTMGSCGRNSETWKAMDKAESLMETMPDSALFLLENIPSSSIKGKEMAARYALLKSMALDKNYIDTTNFKVLQPALDYYLKHGTPNERLRTYYYQGRIYQNRGDDDSAMCSFINACDLKQKATDTLVLAHTLVAQGTLYYKQYSISEFIHNNMEAARLYEVVNKDLFAIMSYTNALDGYMMKNDKSMADSLLAICEPMVRQCPDGEAFLFPSLLSYTIRFRSPHEIKAFLDKYQNKQLAKDEIMNFAQGYTKIGEYDKAMDLLSSISPDSLTFDSLKYTVVKADILEKLGKYKQTLDLYKDYITISERYQRNLLSDDLLFANQKHKIEMENVKQIQGRDRIILGTLCGILAFALLAGWLYYRGRLDKARRKLTEKENEKLRLEQDILRKDKEMTELERDKKTLEAENLDKDKKRLEAERRQRELETDNLRLEVSQLTSERDDLEELLREQSGLAAPVQHVAKERLDMLNSLLAKEITHNEHYAETYHKWVETIHNDKKKFMDSNRLALTASHPKFIEYLEQHNLSIDEINYVCLYAIGLRGKEVGEYMQLKRHYIISHEIRQKLGLDEHETNLGLYIRRLLKEL